MTCLIEISLVFSWVKGVEFFDKGGANRIRDESQGSTKD
jgi:hypothetical protein